MPSQRRGRSSNLSRKTKADTSSQRQFEKGIIGTVIARITRIIALAALLTALLDAARLLGVGSASGNPVSTMGVATFTVMAGLTMFRLFSAVGMWIYAAWGAVLLFLTSILELLIVITGMAGIDANVFGWLLRLLLLTGSAFLLGFSYFAWRRAVHD